MSYRDQFIWKRAIQLSINCDHLTEKFPKSELYGLISLLWRASVSVPSNIAEGYGRRTQNEYIQFLHIALGSLRELDTQLIIAKEVKLATPELFDPVLEEVDRMQGILVSTLQKLKSWFPPSAPCLLPPASLCAGISDLTGKVRFWSGFCPAVGISWRGTATGWAVYRLSL